MKNSAAAFRILVPCDYSQACRRALEGGGRKSLWIIRYATQTGADLIAIGTLTSADPAHLFRPSVAADIVNHAKIPVYTFQLSHRQVLVLH